MEKDAIYSLIVEDRKMQKEIECLQKARNAELESQISNEECTPKQGMVSILNQDRQAQHDIMMKVFQYETELRKKIDDIRNEPVIPRKPAFIPPWQKEVPKISYKPTLEQSSVHGGKLPFCPSGFVLATNNDLSSGHAKTGVLRDTHDPTHGINCLYMEEANNQIKKASINKEMHPYRCPYINKGIFNDTSDKDCPEGGFPEECPEVGFPADCLEGCPEGRPEGRPAGLGCPEGRPADCPEGLGCPEGRPAGLGRPEGLPSGMGYFAFAN